MEHLAKVTFSPLFQLSKITFQTQVFTALNFRKLLLKVDSSGGLAFESNFQKLPEMPPQLSKVTLR